MAEGSDTDNTGSDLAEAWLKKGTVGEESSYVSISSDSIRVEKGGMGFVLTSPAGKFIFEIIWRNFIQGDHATGKTGNLAVNFSRQGKHREFSKFNFLHRKNCGNTGKILKI